MESNQIVDQYNRMIAIEGMDPRCFKKYKDLTDEELKEAVSIDTVKAELLPKIKDKILIGHNIMGDVQRLAADFNEVIPCTWLDTHKMAQALLKGNQYSLDAISQKFNFGKVKHTALEDCKQTQKVYHFLRGLNQSKGKY